MLLTGAWRLVCEAVDSEAMAPRLLRERLNEAQDIRLIARGEADTVVTLAVDPDAVDTGTGDGRQDQAYVLVVESGCLSLRGAGPAGLFYAVQTLLQLIESGQGRLPLGTIIDWPLLEWRCIHWDTKHHQDRPETLRRYLDEAARLKINAVLFELEDKFEFPSHPVIGAPGAFTTVELQALTRYALDRHIQIIPDVQSPAHMAYVLKHEAFQHLRCDGSNYQICMDRPDARRLLFAMYDDLCRATPGARFFHVSTDEVYYAGICEAYRRPYNPVNRSLTLVDYIRAAHEHLARRNREMIVWLEYPLLNEHIQLLPQDLINGVGSDDPERMRLERARGIRHFRYWPTQGSELLFPRYFPSTRAAGGDDAGRLARLAGQVDAADFDRSPPLGAIAAAWDDAGLHNETFWLGWAHMAHRAWSPSPMAGDAITLSFFEHYHGPGHGGPVSRIYRGLHHVARYHEALLERLPSQVRGSAYGHPLWKGPMPRCDYGMLPPVAPSLPNDTASSMPSRFGARYGHLLPRAPREIARCERLLEQLGAVMQRGGRNRYALDVLTSLSVFLRDSLGLIRDVADGEALLVQAGESGRGGDMRRMERLLQEARGRVSAAWERFQMAFDALCTVWEISRYPRPVVNGKPFVHRMDDVKDHFADRRADMTYLTAPVETLALPTWLARLDTVIAQCAAIAERNGS